MRQPDPKIIELKPKKLVGFTLTMSRMSDKTPQLWQRFMPQRQQVAKRADTNFISMQIYPQGAQQIADPNAEFVKWAVVEVEDYTEIPAGMATYDLAGGLYAVFPHHGPANDLSTVMYIFKEWIPGSAYEVDDREHFELLGEGYRPMDADAYEEFYIPIRPPDTGY